MSGTTKVSLMSNVKFLYVNLLKSQSLISNPMQHQIKNRKHGHLKMNFTHHDYRAIFSECVVIFPLDLFQLCIHRSVSP